MADKTGKIELPYIPVEGDKTRTAMTYFQVRRLTREIGKQTDDHKGKVDQCQYLVDKTGGDKIKEIALLSPEFKEIDYERKQKIELQRKDSDAFQLKKDVIALTDRCKIFEDLFRQKRDEKENWQRRYERIITDLLQLTQKFELFSEVPKDEISALSCIGLKLYINMNSERMKEYRNEREILSKEIIKLQESSSTNISALTEYIRKYEKKMEKIAGDMSAAQASVKDKERGLGQFRLQKENLSSEMYQKRMFTGFGNMFTRIRNNLKSKSEEIVLWRQSMSEVTEACKARKTEHNEDFSKKNQNQKEIELMKEIQSADDEIKQLSETIENGQSQNEALRQENETLKKNVEEVQQKSRELNEKYDREQSANRNSLTVNNETKEITSKKRDGETELNDATLKLSEKVEKQRQANDELIEENAKLHDEIKKYRTHTVSIQKQKNRVVSKKRQLAGVMTDLKLTIQNEKDAVQRLREDKNRLRSELSQVRDARAEVIHLRKQLKQTHCYVVDTSRLMTKLQEEQEIVRELENLNRKLQEENNELLSDLDNLKKQTREFETKEKKIEAESRHYNYLLDQEKQTAEYLRSDVDRLYTENRALKIDNTQLKKQRNEIGAREKKIARDLEEMDVVLQKERDKLKMEKRESKLVTERMQKEVAKLTDELKNSKATLKTHQNESQKDTAKLKKEIDDVKHHLNSTSEKNKRLAEENKKHFAAAKKLDTLKDEIEGKNKDLNQKVEQLEKDKTCDDETSRKNINNLNDVLAKQKENVKALEDDKKKLIEEIKEKQINVDNLEKSCKDSQSTIDNLTKENSDMKDLLTKTTVSKETQTEEEEISQELAKVTGRNEELSQQVKELDKENQNLNSRIERAKEFYQKDKENIVDSEAQVEILQQDLTALQKKMAILKNNDAMLHQMEKLKTDNKKLAQEVMKARSIIAMLKEKEKGSKA